MSETAWGLSTLELQREIERLREENKALKARLKNNCGLCVEGKPCNQERCPNDTVLAADYNALKAECEKLVEAMEKLKLYCLCSEACICSEDMMEIAREALAGWRKNG